MKLAKIVMHKGYLRVKLPSGEMLFHEANLTLENNTEHKGKTGFATVSFMVDLSELDKEDISFEINGEKLKSITERPDFPKDKTT